VISVLVPSYNHRAYVGAALLSIQAQTFADIEVIIVDDASTDGSPSVIAQIVESLDWRQRFPKRSKFIAWEKNQGAHAAINFAARHASGELLAILNSDDLYFPDRLRTLAGMVDSGSEFVFSRSVFVEEKSNRIGELDSKVRHLWEAQNRIQYYPTVGLAFLCSNVALTTGNLLVTHGLFDELGGMSGLRYCHDWDFCLRAALRTEPRFCDVPLYAYRIHDTNTSRSLYDLSEVETGAVRRRFLAEHWAARNPLAPTPNAWPGIYEVLTEWVGY
jgi:glycosyltransferase involved in cell wall biosynthesis